MVFKNVYGYLVTEDGRVFLEEEVVICRNKSSSWSKTLPLREMKPTIDSRGYLFVKAPRRKRMWVARLVAIGWIPNPLNKKQVNHINGIKTDNNAHNLEWCTASENLFHAHRTGLRVMAKGEKNHNSILTNELAKSLYIEIKRGYVSQEKLAKMFGVKQITVSNIKTKKSWKWLTDELDSPLNTCITHQQ